MVLHSSRCNAGRWAVRDPHRLGDIVILAVRFMEVGEEVMG